MLESLAPQVVPEAATVTNDPAVFETPDGTRAEGSATVEVSRASIAIRFMPREPLTVAKAAYGEDNGSITGKQGWIARHVNHAGVNSAGEHRFGTLALTFRHNAAEVAATRLVIAGASWTGTGTVGGRRVIAAPLSRETVSHHDQRMSIAFEGDADDTLVETMGRATAFVAGIDVEVLLVERYSAQGIPICVEHRRGYRRVGRGTHSPFSGVADEHRMRAWSALVEAFPHLLATGVPIDMIVDQISAHNQVAQIHVSAQLLLMATVTAAHQRLHGTEVGPAAVSRRKELEALDRDLGLGLKEEDYERYDRLRVELLDAGFFHKPGYETGRPQKDIKFLRDIAYVTVLRLCEYTGPFYGAERFTVRQLSTATP